MQTPMQNFFPTQPPGAPGRPSHQLHPSIAQLTAAGIHPPNGMPPMTPLVQGHFHHPSMMLAAGPHFGQQFAPRNRRQPSIGGPPKAVLGGPARKLSPLPPAGASTPPVVNNQKAKKVAVNFPKESVPGIEGEGDTHPPWARTPLKQAHVATMDFIVSPDLTTADLFPPDSWRYHVPLSVDVFLPGKVRYFRSH